MASEIMLEVYPRVCGGTAPARMPDQPGSGLSPRVRGNRPGTHARSAGLGSIPACAGEPLSSVHHFRSTQVYPRVCGGTSREPRASTYTKTVCRGLSPRVRGNPLAAALAAAALGSIPACAGEPVPEWRRKRWAKVYPRVCGGTICTDRRA